MKYILQAKSCGFDAQDNFSLIVGKKTSHNTSFERQMQVNWFENVVTVVAIQV